MLSIIISVLWIRQYLENWWISYKYNFISFLYVKSNFPQSFRASQIILLVKYFDSWNNFIILFLWYWNIFKIIKINFSIFNQWLMINSAYILIVVGMHFKDMFLQIDDYGHFTRVLLNIKISRQHGVITL